MKTVFADQKYEKSVYTKIMKISQEQCSQKSKRRIFESEEREKTRTKIIIEQRYDTITNRDDNNNDNNNNVDRISGTENK